MGMDMEEEADDALMPAEGYEFVFADTVADFSFPFQMEEEDAELSVNVVNAFEDTDMEIEAVMDFDVPLNELVTGKVRGREREERKGNFTVSSQGPEGEREAGLRGAHQDDEGERGTSSPECKLTTF